LSVNITILKSEVASKLTDMMTLRPFSGYVDCPEFSDISFRVIEQEEEDNTEAYLNQLHKRDSTLYKDKEAVDAKVRIFHGHKNILAAISPWFHMLFTNGMQESQQQEIKIIGVQHAIFYRLLKYCYAFEIDMDNVNDAYEMLRASDRFQIVPIREETLGYLRQELNEDNIWDIWECAGKLPTTVCYIVSHSFCSFV
jgi:hypothetical protein